MKSAMKEALVEIDVFLKEHMVLLHMVATDGLEAKHWWDNMGRLASDDYVGATVALQTFNDASNANDPDSSPPHPPTPPPPLNVAAVSVEVDDSDTHFKMTQSDRQKQEKVLGVAYEQKRLNLSTLIDIGLQHYTHVIAKICHRAKEQRKIEVELDAMANLWGEISLAWLELKRTAPTVPQKAWVSAKAKLLIEQQSGEHGENGDKNDEQDQEEETKTETKIETKTETTTTTTATTTTTTTTPTINYGIQVTWRSVYAVELLIEEQLTRVKLLQASPFVGPHLRRCYHWETRLDAAELVMNQWWELQNSILKLSTVMGLAVFANGTGTMEEVLGRDYRSMESKFNQMQKECEAIGRVPQHHEHGTYVEDTEISLVPTSNVLKQKIQSPSLSILGGIVTLPRLRSIASKLDQIKFKLRKAVDKRCERFPRLWLLSEDQIFLLMSDSRHKVHVQSHLPKLFTGVRGIMFGSGEAEDSSTAGYIDAGDITAVYTDDGEMIGLAKRPAGELIGMKDHLLNVLEPNIINNPIEFNKVLQDSSYINPEGQRSTIDVWMLQLETEIRRTVASQIEGAVKAWPQYDIQMTNRGRKIKLTPKEALDKWIKRWPYQALQAASEIHWANGVEKILRNQLLVNRKKKIKKDNEKKELRKRSKEDQKDKKDKKDGKKKKREHDNTGENRRGVVVWLPIGCFVCLFVCLFVS